MICRFQLCKLYSSGRAIFLFLLSLFLSCNSANNSKDQTAIYSSDPQILSEGQRIFENNCSSCHNFLQRSIGPSLQKATTDLPEEWLRKFIQNAPEMITSGDSRAGMLYKEYKQVMPPFSSLNASQVDAILAFIHKNQKLAPISQETGGSFIKDPIPTPIPLTGGKLYLEYQSTAPATGTKAPLARINKMQSLKGKHERLFVVDLEGILYEIVDKEWKVAMNIRKLRPHFVSFPGLGTGFGSFAFHPEFHKNGLLYTTHAERVDSVRGDLRLVDTSKVRLQWVLTEWKIRDPSVTPFISKGRELLRIDMPTTSHGVQEITFNPLAQKGQKDYGLLYIGVGDGGAGEKGYYTLCNSNKGALSSVLRIDPLGHNSANGRYGIPPSNPYADEKDSLVIKEIFCRGFRNPNRISWTPDGKMLICDIGQSNIEEINLGTAGADYGWPEREGTFLVNPRGDIGKVFALPGNEPSKKYTYPILQYDHDEGRAISGGFVYNGSAIPNLKGKYVFADITNGRFFLTENHQLKQGELAPIKELEIWIDNELTTFQKINGTAKPDARLGVGPAGELYVFTKANGRLYKVVGFSRR
jgi:glucose/arabinose dehydrogenase/mono/diheme cytochrome c family protein